MNLFVISALVYMPKSLSHLCLFIVRWETSGILYIQLSLKITITTVVIVNMCASYRQSSLRAWKHLILQQPNGIYIIQKKICHLLDTYCVLGTTYDALIPTYSHFTMNWKLEESKKVTIATQPVRGEAWIWTQRCLIPKPVFSNKHKTLTFWHISPPFWPFHLVFFFTAKVGDLFFLPETSHRLSPTCSSFPGNILLPSCPQHPFQIGESVNFSPGREKWGYRLDRVELNTLIALFKMWCLLERRGSLHPPSET